ncbi:hypothetical protein IU510_29710 [Nocardia cyriacigeorgica]|uniref:hypothetical protein n=1 Tax=Nocardia cyriacigeorgica TaxID=135487 RepID=UPI001894AB63|nr:hypothetical protein [Nocardia cyriacigeorgica]MBF6102197.1 hypothetical protein [Nocardia cyriacigeorgica]MBF6347364.1 hypothetical protein [Nocardia cyriacigeorgica]
MLAVTVKDLFLDAIEDAKHIQRWPEAVALHEHVKMLASEFGKRQHEFSPGHRRTLLQLRDETMTKVRNALHHARIERDIAEHTANRERWEAERATRLAEIDRDLALYEREREAPHAFRGLTERSLPEREWPGFERER